MRKSIAIKGFFGIVALLALDAGLALAQTYPGYYPTYPAQSYPGYGQSYPTGATGYGQAYQPQPVYYGQGYQTQPNYGQAYQAQPYYNQTYQGQPAYYGRGNQSQPRYYYQGYPGQFSAGYASVNAARSVPTYVPVTTPTVTPPQIAAPSTVALPVPGTPLLTEKAPPKTVEAVDKNDIPARLPVDAPEAVSIKKKKKEQAAEAAPTEAAPAAEECPAPVSETTKKKKHWKNMPAVRHKIVSKEESFQEPPCPVRLYTNAEALFWWLKNSRMPSLVTAGSPTDLPPGALGQPGSHAVFGNSVDNEMRLGGRLTAGYWLGDNHRLGFEGSFFYVFKRTVDFTAGSPGAPVLALPFTDAVNNSPSAQLITFPGAQTGTVHAALSSKIWGGEASFRSELLKCDKLRVTALAGFRYLELIEALDLTENTTIQAGTNAGATGNNTDHFGAGNYFYGGQVGGQAELNCGRLSLSFLGKLGVGTNHQIVNINGTTLLTSPGGVQIPLATGFLARGTNGGRHSHDSFSLVPEAGITANFQVTSWLRASVGGNFLYWTNTVRPGSQVDQVLNSTQLPPPLGAGVLNGAPRPAFSFKETDFWAFGANAGLEIRF